MDFDQEIERRGSGCLKYDFAVERGLPADVLPLWVADMDFKAPQPVLDALIDVVEHGVFGYNDVKQGSSYFRALKSWIESHHGWSPQEDWLVRTPGVVFSLANAVRAFTEPGDEVIIQSPVYYPFASVIRANDRSISDNTLHYQNGHYTIDFEDLARRAASPAAKLMLLCSPHNPVGRVWTREELEHIAQICAENNVRIISDEIHADFIHDGAQFVSLYALDADLIRGAVCCTAPSKTFNLAGLQVANIFIADPAARERYQRTMQTTGYSHLNNFAIVGCEAAYSSGGPWLEELKHYIWANFDFLREFLRTRLPQLKLVEAEGTYLAWIDFSETGLSGDELNRKVIDEARLWLDNGEMFGEAGRGFQRINLACTRKTLTEALERLERAFR